MTYSQAVSFLSSLSVFGIKLGLERPRKILSLLKNPQKKMKIIHIAGTNGKGSVGAMLCAILKEGGVKTGFYSSPHLYDWRERIRIPEDKREGLISREDFAKQAGMIRSLSAEMTKEGEPLTAFEFLTVMAFNHFASEKADAAVVEVGMGGRLDATNVCRPALSIITNIGLEHTGYLGRTKEEIAEEKGGIIKPGVPVITAESDPKVLGVIARIAARENSVLTRVSPPEWVRVRGIVKRGNNLNMSVNAAGKKGRYPDIVLPLLGAHQAKNSLLALRAAELLDEQGIFRIEKGDIIRGLGNTSWGGRLEIVSHDPLVIYDGAHNPDSARVLSRAVRDFFGNKKVILIFACLRDKDRKGMLRFLLPLSSQAIFPLCDQRFFVYPDELVSLAKGSGKRVRKARSVKEAWSMARASLTKDTLVLFTGSFYLAGGIKNLTFRGL